MRHNLLISILLAMLLLSTASGFSKGKYMQVANHRVTVDDKRCYLIKKGLGRKDTTKWELFCGEFSNFYYEEGYPYQTYVEKYDPHADTIHVIKTIGHSSDTYWKFKKQKELRRKKAVQDSIKAASESPVTEPDNKEKK